MPTPVVSYKTLRRKLDDLGYYQPLVPEAVPLVEALLHDLLATTHNLKICKEQKSVNYKTTNKDDEKTKQTTTTSQDISEIREIENIKIIGLQRKVGDLELLHRVF
jgi:hypothetical protein